ncbi:unnamed protein product [Bursaphelenchus okinawaensis]|uniref:Uncharacterized protein n=1 Tax=Bursaphelenchus okinawaensis TaxID=465554 RepID=A0A811K6K7_9BILA|nr:unnamed protein product [Bursaphelenchus okinawaensis]CAG9094054.1 unnamed protein product [Bursaphelenchus okinawaensis]
MTERPPTSRARTPASRRPKTASQGRPPTSAGRPPSSVPRTIVPRPPSAARPPSSLGRPSSRRSVLTEDTQSDVNTTMAIRSASRLGSAMPGSRAGLSALEGRIATGQIPEGTLRPTTQQGFVAQRPGSRLRTGVSGRQIADKTYFIGLLNTQLTALEEEISSLENELQKAEREQRNLLVYEQKAEEQANELKQLQGEFADYNLIIDRQNTNVNVQELEVDIETQEKTNEELTNVVQDLFHERQQKEDACHELEQELEASKKSNMEYMDEIGHSKKEEYETLKAEMEEYRDKLEKAQNEIKELTKQKENLDLSLAKSPLKQHSMNLQEQIASLKEKKEQLKNEMMSGQTPEDQKNELIEEIKKNNEEISSMREQTEEIEAKIQLTQEELREFENEAEQMAGKHSERYRDLKLRERQLDEFLGSFEPHKVELATSLTKSQTRIVSLLKLISVNCQRDELAATVTGLDESAIIATMDSPANAKELQDLHLRLQEEMVGLEESEQHYQTELESLKKQNELNQQTENEWQNFENNKITLEGELKSLQNHRDDVTNKRSGLDKELDRMTEQFRQLEVRAKSMALYDKFVELKKGLEVTEAERDLLQRELVVRQAEFDYQSLKIEALQLKNELNQCLLESSYRR